MAGHQDASEQRLALDMIASPSRVGLSLPEQMPFAAWQGIGRQIALIADASGWWLGDWLVYGEEKYANRYKRAIAETHLDYQTLRNYAWVARKFALDRRRPKLSLQHHAEVAAMPEHEQDVWLERAELFGWSKSALRRELKSSRMRGDEVDYQARAVVRLTVTEFRQQCWEAAAASANVSLPEWMTEILDEAARSALADQEPTPSPRLLPVVRSG